MEKVRRVLENEKVAVRVCLILIFLGGLMMSFMIPPWQTPDEDVHLGFIGKEIGAPELAGQLYSDIPLEANRIRYKYEEKLNISEWKRASVQPAGYDRDMCLLKGLSPSVLRHLPATIGIELGILLHLPTFWVLELGELFSLIFYVAVCGMAVSMMPMKKEVLLLIMAFPMTLQQAASLNYDAVLLPICFLYVASIFWMRYQKERLRWKEIIQVLLLLLMIVYIKLPYGLFALLLFWLPVKKIHLQIGRFEINAEFLKKWRILLMGMFFLCVLCGLYFIRDNYFLRLLYGMMLELPRTGYLILKSVYIWKKYLMISSVGQFGWLESQLPFAFVVLTFCLLLVLSVWGKKDALSERWNWKSRLLLWCVGGLLGCLIILSMVNHTITVSLYGYDTTDIEYNIREKLYEIGSIGGLQGRYFLPFLVLPFLALPEKGRAWRGKAWLVAVYVAIAMILTAFTLYQRYWKG